MALKSLSTRQQDVFSRRPDRGRGRFGPGEAEKSRVESKPRRFSAKNGRFQSRTLVFRAKSVFFGKAGPIHVHPPSRDAQGTPAQVGGCSSQVGGCSPQVEVHPRKSATDPTDPPRRAQVDVFLDGSHFIYSCLLTSHNGAPLRGAVGADRCGHRFRGWSFFIFSFFLVFASPWGSVWGLGWPVRL